LRRRPVHRPLRCVTSGTLAGARRSHGPRIAAEVDDLPLLVLPSFSGPSSGSLQQRPVPPAARFVPGSLSGPVSHRVSTLASKRRLRGLRRGRCHLLRFFRPRGFHHLDGLLRCWPPACCSRYQIWGSRGWFRVGRWCSSVSRPPSTSDRVRKDPRVFPSKVDSSFGSRLGIAAGLSPPAVPPSRRRDCSRLPADRRSSGSLPLFRPARAPVSRCARGSTHTDRGPWVVRARPFRSVTTFPSRPAFTRVRRRRVVRPASFAPGTCRPLRPTGCPGDEATTGRCGSILQCRSAFRRDRRWTWTPAPASAHSEAIPCGPSSEARGLRHRESLHEARRSRALPLPLPPSRGAG